MVSLLILFSGSIANLLQYPQHIEYIIWFALILGFDALASITFAKLRYEEKALKFAALKLLNIFLSIGLILFFLIGCPRWIDSMPWLHNIYNPEVRVGYIFISNLIASAITLLCLVPEMLKTKWEFDTALWKKMMVYALPLVAVGFAGTINEMLDRVLLKHLLPYDNATNMAHLGIYGACYKLSILMTLFTQAFRMAAEPFFFSQANQSNAQKVYAFAMKYYIIIAGLIFIGVLFFLEFIKHFIGQNYHAGLVVVPILLMANLFLGIYYNLSIWYKLINKTLIGAYIAIFGAVITLVLNIALIPTMGYVGSAWATLICYVLMVVASYLLCQKHYPIPYNIKSMLGYLSAAVLLVVFHQFVILQLPTTIAYIARFALIGLYIGGAFFYEKKSGFNIPS